MPSIRSTSSASAGNVAFFDKGIQIVVAGGIEQAEAGEVALGTELLGSGEGGGRRESSGRGLRPFGRRCYFLGCPFEVVGLVHN